MHDEATGRRKHTANDPKCTELGWVCVPLAVESYCSWGEEVRRHLHSTGNTLSLWLCISQSQGRVISDILVRAIARASVLAMNVVPSES